MQIDAAHAAATVARLRKALADRRLIISRSLRISVTFGIVGPQRTIGAYGGILANGIVGPFGIAKEISPAPVDFAGPLPHPRGASI
jgi:hypothetical protein